MSGSRQISPTGSAARAAAIFLPAGPTDPVVLGGGTAAPVVAAFLANAALLGAPLAMLLAGLLGIGGATRVQFSPPQRKPSTQPLISSWSVPVGVMVEL